MKPLKRMSFEKGRPAAKLIVTTNENLKKLKKKQFLGFRKGWERREEGATARNAGPYF